MPFEENHILKCKLLVKLWQFPPQLSLKGALQKAYWKLRRDGAKHESDFH